jgi:hypothetical protein
MGHFDWDFSKLPEHEYERAIDAYNEGKIIVLITLHNDYKLSKNNYCCSPDEAMLIWFKYGIENNFK